MSPFLALSAWLVLLLLLLYFDPARTQQTSPALWIPVIWMVILGSRLPSQWMGTNVVEGASALQEGNSLDRSVYFVLIFLAIATLASRSFDLKSCIRQNLALTVFVAFALFSVCWSDYSFIAFKRWFRDLGNYLVVLVALSDPIPLEAIRTVLRRFCYLLIPLSIVLIKYFPDIGRQFDYWQGNAMAVGVTTSKNMLGVLCLVSGLFFCWDTISRWDLRREQESKRIIAVNLAFIGMTLWLLLQSNSATSRVCLVLGACIMLAANSRVFRRHPAFLKAFIPTLFFTYLIVAFLGMNGDVAEAVGRNATLTDRTKIWSVLLTMPTNPLVGTGYESFWLGPRLNQLWQQFHGLNEAHNGYLEVYLNLGLVGLSLLAGVLVSSYRKICRDLDSDLPLGLLGVSLWTVVLFYGVTEAAFRSGLLWILFLICTISVLPREQDVEEQSDSNYTDNAESLLAVVE